MRPLTENFRADKKPLTLGEYTACGGYEGYKKVLALSSAEIIDLIKEATLLGRGGAGFATAIKMSAVPPKKDPNEMRYLVVNADEMEPGTFKDRILLENNPHQLLEGVMIGARAIHAKIAYVFLRGEYKYAEKCLEHALAELASANISGDGLRIYVHMSAGRYICGEETALLNALEGRRAIPRAKPPFPQMSGLFGKPTVVQNVETLSNLPHIVRHGALWFKSLGKAIDAGTKMFGVSGKIKNPDAFELPMGTTAREIIFEHGKGMRDGLRLRAFLPGGASTDFLGEDFLDVPMDFSSMAKKGTRMGTGTIIVLDDHSCPVAALVNLERFFKQESCGFCTPCRDGLNWVYETLNAIENGAGRLEDIDMLKRQAKLLRPGSTFCALAPGASAPLWTGLQLFADDFLQHISERACPYQRS
jgi:NADH-quinone oxidoreductase subunit F